MYILFNSKYFKKYQSITNHVGINVNNIVLFEIALLLKVINK